MSKSTLILGVLFWFNVALFAQAENFYKPQSYLSVTWSPSALVNIFPGIQFGIERKWENKHAVEFEAAWLIPVEYDRDVRNFGHRQKLTLKLPSARRYSYNFTLYHRLVKTNTTGDYLVNQDFFRQFDRQVKRRAIHPAFGPSTHFNLSKRLYGEFGVNVGLGIMHVTEESDAPLGAIQEDIFVQFYRDPGVYGYPFLNFQAKIKYVFLR